jgi:hypothetical protein
MLLVKRMAENVVGASSSSGDHGARADSTKLRLSGTLNFAVSVSGVKSVVTGHPAGGLKAPNEIQQHVEEPCRWRRIVAQTVVILLKVGMGREFTR